MSYYSPLRYPGGKNKMYNYTKSLLKKNNLMGCTYCEPFAGGSGLALSLLMKNDVSNIILNDLDRSIYAFWYSVLYETKELCRLIANADLSVDEWQKQKSLQNDKSNLDLLTLGFSTFYLNRTNVSGIIKGGLIGGYEQKGKYKIDCRFKKDDLISRIQLIASHKNDISLSNKDASDFILEDLSCIPPNQPTFVFIDPPYFNKGPSLYLNSFTEENHRNLASLIQSKIKHSFIVTYDNVEVIKDMYHGLNPSTFDIYYSANKKGMAKEIRMLSPNLEDVNQTA